jgi:hypothetical protein
MSFHCSLIIVLRLVEVSALHPHSDPLPSNGRGDTTDTLRPPASAPFSERVRASSLSHPMGEGWGEGSLTFTRAVPCHLTVHSTSSSGSCRSSHGSLTLTLSRLPAPASEVPPIHKRRLRQAGPTGDGTRPTSSARPQASRSSSASERPPSPIRWERAGVRGL